MVEIEDAEFERIISQAIDELPSRYIKNLNNVAIVYEDEPTPEQREKLKLRGGQTLFGLYEGVPRIKRGNGYNLVLPDKITIFKKPAQAHALNIAQLKANVKHTLWHEIAHHYGLGHDRIHELESE